MTIYDRFGNDLTTAPEEPKLTEPAIIFDSKQEGFEIELFNEQKDLKIIITKIIMPPDFGESSQMECEYTCHQVEGCNRVIDESEILDIIGFYLNEKINAILEHVINSYGKEEDQA